jgi:hypothetical protein
MDFEKHRAKIRQIALVDLSRFGGWKIETFNPYSFDGFEHNGLAFDIIIPKIKPFNRYCLV